MFNFKFFPLVACSLALLAPRLYGAKPNLVVGPAKVQLGSSAQIEVPAGYVFLDGKQYRAVLKAEGEPTSGQEMGWLKATNQDWAVVFEFADVGFVKDDDKDSLNADKLLDSIKRGTAEANKLRVSKGNKPIEVIGWEVPPRYDSATHNLEWAIRGSVDGQLILNYNTRLLGRKGVMEVVLIVEPDNLAATLPVFRELMTRYSFLDGQTYAEYRPGDKLAKYGLGALIVGGSALGAAKLGLFTWLLVFFKKAWKLVVVGAAALAASVKKLFAKLTGRSSDSNDPGSTA